VRRALLLLALFALPAFAEGGWLTSRGRLQPELRLEAWGGTESFGAGVVAPDVKGAKAAVLIEALYAYRHRAVELRGGRVWQFTASRFATAAATLSGAAYLVPEGFDVGIGPHGNLSLALGGEVFTVDLALETGAELFVRSLTTRIPLRGGLGLNLRVGDWGFGAQARLGADVIPGANFVGRGELILSVSWFGLGRAAER
jgi:hypothetical protein